MEGELIEGQKWKLKGVIERSWCLWQELLEMSQKLIQFWKMTQPETKEILWAPIIDCTVHAAHTEEINVLISGLNSDGTRGNGFNL